jgi:GINS complex subunit 4
MDDSSLPNLSTFGDDLEYDEGEEGEVLTAAQVLAKLEEAWMNEKFSPELLPHRSEIVDCVMEQLHEMQRNIDQAKKADFKVSVHKMEIDRIRFVLSSYLRARVQKIERFAEHILETERQSGAELLTDEERTFATSYQSSVLGHFKSLALRHMPATVQGLDTKKTTVLPNLDSYVFVKVIKDVAGVVVEEETADSGEEIVDLQANDQLIMRYKPLAALIASGDVVLM